MRLMDIRGLRHSESFPGGTCLPMLLLILSAVPPSGESRDACQ